MLSWSSRSNSGGYLRDYRPQWTPFFSPYPVVTQSASSTGAVFTVMRLNKPTFFSYFTLRYVARVAWRNAMCSVVRRDRVRVKTLKYAEGCETEQKTSVALVLMQSIMRPKSINHSWRCRNRRSQRLPQFRSSSPLFSRLTATAGLCRACTERDGNHFC